MVLASREWSLGRGSGNIGNKPWELCRHAAPHPLPPLISQSFPSLPHVVPPCSQLRPPAASLSCPEGLVLVSHAGNAASECFCVLPARSLGKGPGNAVREEQWGQGKTTARLLHFLMGKHLCEVLSSVSLLKLPPPPSPCPRISHPLMQRRRGCSTTTEN